MYDLMSTNTKEDISKAQISNYVVDFTKLIKNKNFFIIKQKK